MVVRGFSLSHSYLFMDNSDSLCKKNILLTGGGSGMGQATALSLADHGANVLIAGRNINALNSTISKSAVPDKINAKEADVTNRDSLNELFSVRSEIW